MQNIFRAWDKQNKQFLEGFTYPYGHSGLWLDIETGELTHIEGLHSEDGYPSTAYNSDIFKEVELSQKTSIKDRKGNYYFIGDIVDSGGGVGVLVWHGSSLGIASGTVECFHAIDSVWENDLEMFTIIGNVYENPEFLEEDVPFTSPEWAAEKLVNLKHLIKKLK